MPKFSPKILQSVRNMDRVGKASGKKYYKIPCGGSNAIGALGYINCMKEIAKLLELDFTPTAENVHLIDMCGPDYTIPSPEGNAAIHMMAENEGLFLDPVYTGKAFAGLVKMAREGQFKPTDNVLYLYSGGAGGLFTIDIELD